MTFVGIDHSTTGVKVGVLDGTSVSDAFVLDRKRLTNDDVSFLDELSNYVDPDDIELAAIGYSYGDGISSIRDVESIENRGIVDTAGLGHRIGGGTVAYDELVRSDVPCVAFPGIHDGLSSLHPYFRYYSHLTGADKVAMTRYAQQLLEREESSGTDFISSCVSSSSMATLVCDGELKGAFHWMGLTHGMIDVELLRRVASGEESPKDLYFKNGLAYRNDLDVKDIEGVPDEDILRKLYWATLHHIYSLFPFSEYVSETSLDGVVLSGRLSRVEEPFPMGEKLRSAFSDVAPTHICEQYSTAAGAAHIARDVATGASNVLGIPVEW